MAYGRKLFLQNQLKYLVCETKQDMLVLPKGPLLPRAQARRSKDVSRYIDCRSISVNIYRANITRLSSIVGSGGGVKVNFSSCNPQPVYKDNSHNSIVNTASQHSTVKYNDFLNKKLSIPNDKLNRNRQLSEVLNKTKLSNHFLSHQRTTMLSNVLAKFISTEQRDNAGSGVPMEVDVEDLLSNPKGNKKIRINACGQLYAELSKTKPTLYGYAPKDRGIDFIVTYYDSFELLNSSQRSEAPIVCLLHGAPGHYKDFVSLINYLTVKGIRVIAPSFPDYSATFDYSFRHSPRERLDYLLRFFEAIQVNSIDLLVGHSSAVYTMFELLNQSLNQRTNKAKIQVKSLALFNTPTYNLPPNMVVTPIRMCTLKLFDYPILRPVILALIHIFVKLQGIQNRVDSSRIENLLIAASAVGYSESEKMVDYLKLVQKFKIPTFVLVGCNDRLLSMKCFGQLKRDLGLFSEKQVKHYDHNGDLEKDAREVNELVEVSQFASGGHYTFQRFAQQVNKDLYSFLSRKVLSVENEASKL